MYAGSGADMALTSDPFSGGAYAFGDANPISNIEIDGHSACANTADAICPGETTAAVKSGAAQQDKFIQQYWRSTISDTVNWDLNKCDAVPSCVYHAEQRLATNPGYLADQVQGYLGAQLYDAERQAAYLEQQQAQQSSGGCGILGFNCALRWAEQHKAAIGIGLGVLAFGTGIGAAIIGVGVLGAALGFVAGAAGVGAGALDYGPCRHGDRTACFGAALGAIGGITGLAAAASTVGVAAGVLVETGGVNIALQAFGAFGLSAGAAGTALDVGSTYGSGNGG